MKTITKHPDFHTGLEEVDLQHAFFIDLIERLTPALENSHDLTRQVRLLEEVQLFAAFHFHSEENLYMEHGLDENHLAHHQKRHGELLGALNHYIFQLQQGQESVESILLVLGDWFSYHAVEEDGFAVDRIVAQKQSESQQVQSAMQVLELKCFESEDPFG
ncbi:bacteriohemerythrin [Magnetococcus sp. PR-3]|uniref:bacteriohemerythrin n=1 Tax=Magnetococcus sp. PR-3 TaxID=3120355 RepID=UPI002FCE2F89